MTIEEILEHFGVKNHLLLDALKEREATLNKGDVTYNIIKEPNVFADILNNERKSKDAQLTIALEALKKIEKLQFHQDKIKLVGALGAAIVIAGDAIKAIEEAQSSHTIGYCQHSGIRLDDK